jgi:hypothetical protein
MKTNIVDAIALIAAAIALILMTVSPELVVSIMAGAGIVSVFCSDFARSSEGVRVAAAIVPFDSSRPSSTETREAA